MKKLIKRSITAVSDESALDNAIDDIKSNFDYIIDGFLKLQREGSAQEKEALAIALELSSVIDSISNKVSEAIIK